MDHTHPQCNVYAVKHYNMYKVYDTKKFLDGIFFFNETDFYFLIFHFCVQGHKTVTKQKFSTCIIQILVLMTKIV